MTSEFLDGKVLDASTNEPITDFVEIYGVILARRWYTDWQYADEPNNAFLGSSCNSQRVVTSSKNYEGLYPLACHIEKTKFFGGTRIVPSNTEIEFE